MEALTGTPAMPEKPSLLPAMGMAASTAAPAKAARWQGLAVFGHGFRPFFLLTAIWALASLAVWLLALSGAPLPEGPLAIARWHAHEMIAGFIGAAMGGFLLTAIPNWTGRPAYAGWPLIGLAALFVIARLVLLPGAPFPATLTAIIALLPLPGLLLMVLPALIKERTARLFGPPALILVFWVGDLLMLGDMAGWWTGMFAAGRLLALDVALVLVGLIGGRIVPTFTLNALRAAGTPREAPRDNWPDRAAIMALVVMAVVDLLAPDGLAAGMISALAAALVLLRMSRWHGLMTLRQPIVWVLHLAYLLIGVALATKAAWLLAGADWASGWLHLQAVGAIATMILAVMTRATLGHTGRDLVVAPPVVLAYALLPLAALLRAFGPLVMTASAAYLLAGLAWVGAFGIFLAVFGPMLLSPRADGKPG